MKSIILSLMMLSLGLYVGYTVQPMPKVIMLETDVPVCAPLPVKTSMIIRASELGR